LVEQSAVVFVEALQPGNAEGLAAHVAQRLQERVMMSAT
jgi:hypothetical protein